MDSPPYLIGGSAWLNLVNTRFMHNKEVHDVLLDNTEALQWLQANQLLRTDDISVVTANFLSLACKELARLRELCVEIISDLEKQNEPSEAVFVKLKERTDSLSIVTGLARTAGKLVLTHEGKNPLDDLLYGIIRSIVDTLDNYSADRVRKCEHEECILHFVDTSKSGKRRWCSMEKCGNRYKAAEFYAKKKKQQAPSS